MATIVETLPENFSPLRAFVAVGSSISIVAGSALELAGVMFQNHEATVGGFVLGAVGIVGLGLSAVLPSRQQG